LQKTNLHKEVRPPHRARAKSHKIYTNHLNNVKEKLLSRPATMEKQKVQLPWKNKRTKSSSA